MAYIVNIGIGFGKLVGQADSDSSRIGIIVAVGYLVSKAVIDISHIDRGSIIKGPIGI